jgi:hypothetical protein
LEGALGMNKKLFNSLTIIEQINYFNERLKHGLNITQVCSEINISYNTIRDRFSKNFYVYNKLNNRYECVEKIFPLDEEVIERALEKVVIKIFNSPQDNPNTNNQLLIEPKEDKIVHRSFRIYDSVLKDFLLFCEKSSYNQYEILSKFIEEGIKSYFTN